MRVAIITLIGYKNYGNRLQNYALQETIKKFNNCEVFTISNSSTNQKNTIMLMLKNLIYKAVNIHKTYFLTKKTNNFKGFINDQIKQVDFEDVNLEKVDFFIAGSDQIWNPFFNDSTDFMFLSFSSKQRCNIAYAPSFGVEELPKEITSKYKKLLSNIGFLSVREEAGKDIIYNILKKNVPVLVDPTLLLTKQEWLKISKPHKYRPREKYLLTYFLGNEKENNIEFIEKYATTEKLKIIHLGDIKDKKRYTIGPGEFLDYFNNADCIFTDSFHGSVFAILFEKPFVVFKRGNMNSRIDTLLDKFQLKERHWDYVNEHQNYSDIDFSHVPNILREEREKSFNFLRHAFGIMEDK